MMPVSSMLYLFPFRTMSSCNRGPMVANHFSILRYMYFSCLLQFVACNRGLISSGWRLFNTCGQSLPDRVRVTCASGAPRLPTRRLSSTETDRLRCLTCDRCLLQDIRSIYATRDPSSGGVNSWRSAALCSKAGLRSHFTAPGYCTDIKLSIASAGLSS
jgi:hypothetical protein